MSLINKIKELFNTEIAVETKFTDAKTKDGQILKITEEVKEGAMVEVVSEDGTATPAKGEYTLEDGTVITCDDTGMIASISKEVAPVEEEEAMGVEETVEAEVATTESDNRMFSVLTNRVNQLEEAFKLLVEGLKQNKTEMQEVKSENEKLKTEMSKVKSAPTVSFKKTIEKTVAGSDKPKQEKSEMQKIIASIAEKHSK